jgi:hypothetical protein
MTAASVVQPDITLLLDLDGIIQRATLSSTIGDEGLTDWVGRPWFDTVADITGPKVREIIADARRRSRSGSPAAPNCRWSTPRSGSAAIPG